MDTTTAPLGATSTATAVSAAGSGQANPGTEDAAAALTSDFETFLRMLTTQMENQDPLDPMKSDQFALQLATFSGVEQQVLTNDLLSALSEGFGAGGVTGLADWIGLEVKGEIPLEFDGTPVTLYPQPAARADTAELVVRDAAGAEVQRIAIPVNSEPVVWAGVTDDGTPLASGRYSFEVESTAAGEPLDSTVPQRYATVAEARTDGEDGVLRMSDGTEIAIGKITAVRDPALADADGG